MTGNYKILIADDSESYLRIIQQIFEIVGYKYELIFARNGKEACDFALMHSPDLIILDIIMPEMNGIDAAKFLKNNDSTNHIPIIMLSATESLKAAYEVGANDFISKPFNQYELLIKVRSALDLVSKINSIRITNQELEQKNDLVQKQHDIILDQQNEILGDLNYSKRIQKSILPTKTCIEEIINENFILNIPRNQVSGDFYWIGKQAGRSVITVADCTGHGISGALMTMAGMAFLNEIMGRSDTLNPCDILFELRKMVMHLLQQKGDEGEASDGMDIAFTMLNENKTKLIFAGANNPAYIIKNGEMIILKSDRMPIGIHLNFNRPFVDNTIDVKKGDVVYLFSDGYVDQFGGPHNKKFRYKQFQDLLLEIHSKPMDIQKDILLKTFVEWKGDQHQVDDVLVLGYRI